MLRLDGLKFDGGGGSTRYTLASYARKVGMRREKIARPYSPGSFTTPGFLAEQEFKWSGLILTDTEFAQQKAIERLSGLLSDGGLSRLTIDFGEVRWANVQREDIPEPSIVVPGRIASYQVEVSAPDPFLFGKTREYADGVPVIQRGTHAAFPVFVVTGSAPGGYTITGPSGKRIVVTSALTVGTPHTIDTAEGEVMVGGSLGNISVFEPWAIGPGLPGVTHTISAGSLLVRVTDQFS